MYPLLLYFYSQSLFTRRPIMQKVRRFSDCFFTPHFFLFSIHSLVLLFTLSFTVLVRYRFDFLFHLSEYFPNLLNEFHVLINTFLSSYLSLMLFTSSLSLFFLFFFLIEWHFYGYFTFNRLYLWFLFWFLFNTEYLDVSVLLLFYLISFRIQFLVSLHVILFPSSTDISFLYDILPST